MEEVEMVVVGAGIFGLTCTSTYHRLHPGASIIVLDSSSSVGGPWAHHRTFPGLRTNNLLGMYEHPDFPMDAIQFGLTPGEHVPAEKMLEYLEALVDWSGIREFIRLNARVEIIEREGTRWQLQCMGSLKTGPGSFKVKARKLILANGNTNKPFMPTYPRSLGFQPKILHSKDFPRHFDTTAVPQSHTLVVGGGKSAWDISYACAIQQKSTVSMLLRPSGHGPIWMPPTHVTPFSLWLEKLVFTRFFGFMSPCPWAKTSGIEGWLRTFFHNTWLGRSIAGAFWKILGDDVHALNRLDEHPETKKLRPWTNAFETGNTLSIHNYPTSFFELVRQGRVNILIDEVDRFDEGNTVMLQSGRTLNVDTVICATGWHTGNTIEFRPEAVEQKLGIPSLRIDPEDELLVKQTENDLYAQFPCLKRNTNRVYHPNPALRGTAVAKSKQQPYRLHRFLVPPDLLEDRSIAFAGALHTLGTFPCAYIQSLWITAYLDGNLVLPSNGQVEAIKAETLRNSQYCTLRHTFGYGSVSPDLVWDSLPYFDTLLKDLGIEERRKGGWFGLRECIKSYGPEDYRGMVEEWAKSHGVGEESKKQT